ncbi:NTP transferase domain-containing protein [Spirosoma flavum]|uniref:Probable molybdenum cofactor guanylyltransferase n=1 Tax=Spirosoma flavum TaxID=2048557 RepID=A0ABW6AD78_9BACT
MSKLNGLILTGGQSSRMGHDKSQLIYHGKPQREHLTDLLKPYCDDVFWSVNVGQASQLSTTNQPYIVDSFDFPGPLNGILSAFQHDAESAWLVVACDMPLLTVRSFDALVAGRNLAQLATVFYDSDGQLPEPLLGIYEPAFRLILQQALADGEYSPRQLLRQNDVNLLNVADKRELTNINDPKAKAALGL